MAKIVQITPANSGWRALHVARGDNGKVELIAAPLACWALLEEEDYGETYRFVEGYDATESVERCEESGGFVRYLSPGEDPEAYHEEAEKQLIHAERRRKKGAPHEHAS